MTEDNGLFSSFQTYLRSQKNPPSDNTLKNYLADIKHFTKWFETNSQKSFAPSQVTPSDISKFTHFLETAKYYPSTIERHISSLRKFFQFLTTKGLAIKNPLDEVKTSIEKNDPYRLKDFRRFLYNLGRQKNTIKNYLSDLENFFEWLEKTNADYRVSTKAKMEKINSQTIAHYKERLLSIARLSPSSVNRKLSSMRLYCQWAKQEEYLAQNPFEQENLSNEGNGDDLSPLGIPIEEFFSQQPRYSKIAPVRLVQKLSRFTDRLLIPFFVAPLANIFGKAGDKPSANIGKYVKQDFYAPLAKNPLSWLTKKYYIVAFLTLALIGLGGFFAYERFFPSQKPQVQKTQEEQLAEAKKTIPAFSFSGRLAAANGNPITQTSTVIFSFYDDPLRFEKLLYQEVHDVTPDNGGFFTVTLENVPQALLTATTPVYLGTAVQGDGEMRPRQVINADKVVASSLFNSEGNLVLPNESPTIAASLGPLNITASQVVIRTIEQSNGSIVLWPDGIGKIDVLSPLTNSITGKVEVADALSVNASGATDAFSVQIGSSPVFTIDNQGALSAGAGQFGGSITPSKNNAYNLGSSLTSWKTLYVQNVIAGSSGTQGYWQRNAQAISPSNITDDLLIGGTATSSATFRVTSSSGNVKTSGTLSISGASNFSGTITISGPANDITTGSGEHLALMPTGSGNVGVGLTMPGSKLSVQGGVSIGSYSFATGAGPTNGLSVSGNVGVGTSTPGASLQIAGNGVIGFGEIPAGFAPINGLAVFGNVGIGLTNPQAQLQVGNNATIGYGEGTIGPTNGLAIAGNVGIGTTTPAAKLDVAGGGRFSCASNFANAGGITSCSDVAEVYSSDENLERGDVLRITSEQKVGKTTKTYDGIIGVYSTSPGILVGADARIGGGEEVNLPQGKVPVALAGRVPTKVSTENGPIAVGDFLTSSSTQGVAMKAIRAGPVLGRALEPFNCERLASSKITSSSGNNYTLDANNLDAEFCQGKILVFVNVSYADPDFDLAKTTHFQLIPVDSEQIPKYTIYDAVGELTEKVAAYSDAIIANLDAGTIRTQFLKVGKVTSDTINVTRELIANVLHVNELRVTNEIISPLAEIDRVRTNMLSPLASDSIRIHLGGANSVTSEVAGTDSSDGGKLIVENSQGKEVASIDSQGNASFSGQLTAGEATVSGTLRVSKLIADQIVGLQAQIATLAAETLSGLQESTESASPDSLFIIHNSNLNVEASDSATLHIDRFFADTGSFLDGLLAIGPSGFSDVSISGILSLGSQFILHDNSINVLGADLKLQPLGQGGVSIADGRVYIDSNGNMRIQGNLDVEGTLRATIISPIPDGDLVIRLSPLSSRASDNERGDLPQIATGSANPRNDDGRSLIVQDASGSAVLRITDQGDLIASGSARFAEVESRRAQFIKLSIPQLIEKVRADGQKEVANASVGKGTISAGSYEITIETPFVTEQSLIYISPTSDTDGMVPFIARQIPKSSFTVAIDDFINHDLTFNWWIIN